MGGHGTRKGASPVCKWDNIKVDIRKKNRFGLN